MLNKATCHCGDIAITLADQPKEVFECSCSICRRLGVLWAYYHCDDVTFEKGESSTDTYIWNHRILGFHRCRNCGCVTHWIATDTSFREKMGVNARLIDGLSPANTSVGHVDHGENGCFWTNVTVAGESDG